MSVLVSRHAVGELRRRTRAILAAAGARADIAEVVADILVEGDLLGHDTHGLALLGPYVGELLSGGMAGDGGWTVLRSLPAADLWDGQRLPGPWLVKNAIEVAARKARACGVGAVSVGRSHHIACLAAYLEEPSREGLLTTIQSSDPSAAGVAPHGGTRAVISPNPVAAGIPAHPQPILVDVSTSITTFGMARRTAASGERLPGAWLLDASGVATNDPAVLDAAEPGTLLPLGGVESGHKGFGLGLLVEAMTGALSGRGRARRPTEWSASFLVTVYDPEAFGGLQSFLQETGFLTEISKGCPPADANSPVRLPGERGLARRALALKEGVTLRPAVEQVMEELETRLGLGGNGRSEPDETAADTYT